MSGATERVRELLADRALEGLDEQGTRELAELGGASDDSFERAAAAAALAELAGEGLEALPAALADRVLERAPAAPAPTVLGTGPRARARRPLSAALGWGAAMAAAAAAAYAFLRPPAVVERVVERERVVQVAAPPARVPTPAEARADLLAQAADTTTLAWAATKDPAARGASGDVVWSQARQQGFLRIRGLAANDPARAQYQLWIFDGRREAAHPVDGGVFDVVDGEVVVPIHAAIRVFEPKLFAVTVERPGGVVVSRRQRIVLTASL